VNKYLFIPLAIVLVAALIFGGCKPSEETPTEILIGESTSLTGMYAGFATGGTFGIQAGFDDINKQGGIYIEEYGEKLPIRLIIVDNESNELKAGSLAEDLLVRDNVHALIVAGAPQAVMTPVSTIADRYKIPYVGTGGLKEQFFALRETASPPWEYTWNASFALVVPYPPGSFWDKPGYTMADTMMAWLLSIVDQTNGKAALFATDDIDGRAAYGLFPMVLGEAGFSTCGLEEELGIFPMGTTDFTSIIQEWIDCDCDILLGVAPAPDFGTLLRQCHTMGFKPKSIFAPKAAMFYTDVSSWGGDLPLGILVDMLWTPSYDPEMCPGIGDTTSVSLYERWHEETGETLNTALGVGYCAAQIMGDAIERAGSLDPDTLNEAIGDTHLDTIWGPIVFDKETHYAGSAISFGQWRKTDEPWVWELQPVFALQEYMGETAEFVFPIPYD